MVFIVQRNQRLKSSPAFWLCSETHTSAGQDSARKMMEKTSDLAPSTPAPHCARLLSGSKHSNVWAIEWTSFKIRRSYLFHHTAKVCSVSISRVSMCVHACTRKHTATPVFRDSGTAGLQEGLHHMTWPSWCGISKFIGSEMWVFSSKPSVWTCQAHNLNADSNPAKKIWMAPKPVRSLCLLRNVQIFLKKKWNKSPSIKKKKESPRYQRHSIIVQVFYCNDFNNQSYFYTRYYVKLYVWTDLAVIHMPRRFRTIIYDSWSVWNRSFQNWQGRMWLQGSSYHHDKEFDSMHTGPINATYTQKRHNA